MLKLKVNIDSLLADLVTEIDQRMPQNLTPSNARLKTNYEQTNGKNVQNILWRLRSEFTVTRNLQREQNRLNKGFTY